MNDTDLIASSRDRCRESRELIASSRREIADMRRLVTDTHNTIARTRAMMGPAVDDDDEDLERWRRLMQDIDIASTRAGHDSV
jgi:hypothetical protein